MKHTMKKALCLLLLTAVFCSVTVSARADQIDRTDLQVVYNGETYETNFNPNEMLEGINNILPGDEVTIEVEVINASSETNDLYMTNEVLKTFEESTSGYEGAYKYSLVYINPIGTATRIFDSDTVGGESSSGENAGLMSATETLDEDFYLGRLTAGQSGKVRLKVTVDGECEGNAYQDTLSRL